MAHGESYTCKGRSRVRIRKEYDRKIENRADEQRFLQSIGKIR